MWVSNYQHCFFRIKEVNPIKEKIKDIIAQALDINREEIVLEVPKRKEHGDLSTNVALKYASRHKKNPMELATDIKDKLLVEGIDRIEVINPGFINIYLLSDNKLSLWINKLNNFTLPSLNGDMGISVDVGCMEELQISRTLLYLDRVSHAYKSMGIDVYTKLLNNNVNIDISRFDNIRVDDKDIDYQNLEVGEVIVRNAELDYDISWINLESMLGRNRMAVDILLTPVEETLEIEILNDRLLYYTYPIRRIDIIMERISREGISLTNHFEMTETRLSKKLMVFIEKMSNFEEIIDGVASDRVVDNIMEYMDIITKEFYRVNNNTPIRQLSNDDISNLIFIYKIYKEIISKIFEIFLINTEEVYS